jgi:tetratricopeptide (TPR) repeat protein
MSRQFSGGNRVSGGSRVSGGARPSGGAARQFSGGRAASGYRGTAGGFTARHAIGATASRGAMTASRGAMMARGATGGVARVGAANSFSNRYGLNRAGGVGLGGNRLASVNRSVTSINNFNRYGYGGYGNRFGYGYGRYGYGYGRYGYGNRFGYGLGFGYPYFGFGYPYLGFGYGYPYFGYGLGGYGYGLGGYGYGGYGGYGGYYGGYGGYGGYGYPYGSSYASGVALVDSQPPAAGDYATLGDLAFKQGRYDEAIQNWQHALVDDPQNAGLVMLMGQAFFAKGSYDEAAGAVQQGMQMLPQDKWGIVVQNYGDLYGNTQAFTDQLRALEAAVKQQPDSPALRFLLGYQYAFIGYPPHAVRELDQALKLNPQDQIASQLRDLMRGKLGPAAAPPQVVPGT